MCWVMPPASPLTTLVERMASSSEVLPWSTWPMTVTTGARGASAAGSSAASNTPSSTSASATRLTVWPSSSAMSWAVSASITSLIVAIWPCFIRILMTSTARSAMRLASSWMVIASGIVTSRTSFSFGSLLFSEVRRCTRRRNDASERSRTSSALIAVTSVRRPRGRSVAVLAARVGRCGGAAGRIAPPGPRRTMRGPSFFFGFELRDARRALAPSRSRSRPRRSASWRPRRPSSWCLRRACGARLPRACAPRRPRARSSRWRRAAARILASSSAILRSSASRRRASPSAWARRLCSSSVSVRSTTPDAFGGGAAGAAAGAGAARLGRGRGGRGALGDRRRGRGRRRGLGLAVGAEGAALLDLDDHLLAAAMAEALAHHAGLGARLERQRRLSDAQRLAVRGLGVSHSVLESCQFRSRPVPPWPVSPVRKRSRRAKRAKNVSFAGPASRAACTTFDRPNAKSNWAVVKALMTGDRRRRPSAPPQRAGELGDAVGAGIRSHGSGPRPCRGRSPPRPWRSRPRPVPALPAMASASSAARTSRRSVCSTSSGVDADLALEAAREDVARDGVLERRPARP